MNKYEQLLDLIVNEETEKAEQLFHDIVVEQSRQIYEGLLSDADQELGEISGNGIEEFADDITREEEEITAEAEEEGDDMPDMGDEDGEGEEHNVAMHDGADAETEERIDDLEAMVAELQRAIEDMQGGDDAEMPGAEMGPMDSEGDGDLTKEESVVREYKETVGQPFKGGKVAQNRADGEKSPVASKGGTMPTAKGVDFAGGDEKGRPAPTAKSMNSTTEPKMAKVSGGADKGTGDGEKSPISGQK